MAVYKHLFFDLDHTLWDFNSNAKLALTELYDECELATAIRAPFSSFYEKYLIHNELLWDRYHKGFITAEELKWKRMWRTLLDFKLADEPLSKKLSSRFLEILPSKKQVFPYTREILKYLQEKGYVLHLITNGFEATQRSKLKNSGLDGFFTHMITSETSHSMKPQKEIFEYALKKTDALLRESIMLGDNPEADIAGAINAGMDSVFVNHEKISISLNPTYTVEHLKELENIF